MPEEKTATVEAVSGTEAIARRYVELTSAHEIEEGVALWQPGGIDVLPGARLVAPDEIVEYFRGVYAAFPDFRLEVVHQVTEGERSAIHWRLNGIFEGPGRFEGLEATGAGVELTGVDLVTVRDDRIVGNQAFFDSAELARQLGALPPRGSVAERSMAAALNVKTRAMRLLRR